MRFAHMFLVHSIDLKFLHLMEPFVYFLNFVFQIDTKNICAILVRLFLYFLKILRPQI
jgi:hypothetical protein